MPELPEVQTIVNGLQILIGDTITGFWSEWQKAIKENSYAVFSKEITSKKILSINRIGKFIIINLSQNYSIVIHLRMTGQLLVIEHETWNMKQNAKKFIHHVFYLKKNSVLAFSDMRKFGTITLLRTDALSDFRGIALLGIDALDPKFDTKKLSELLSAHKNKQLKDFLLRQEIISGIGNIYASEILFDAKINPLRKSGSLSKNELIDLHKSILKILKKAVRMRGTSTSDYRDAKGKKGRFQDQLRVYGKTGKMCPRCDTIIEKIVIGQRSTFYCPQCQK